MATSIPFSMHSLGRSVFIVLGVSWSVNAVQVAISSGIGSSSSRAPCHCKLNDDSWTKPTRTEEKCIFIDLGAADGNTFRDFLNNTYGPVNNCANGGEWEAILVEANPRFNKQLDEESKRYPGLVKVMSQTAAYMCEGQTNFFLDTKDVRENFWGSSLSAVHPDVVKSGKQKVKVALSNLNRILTEHTIPGDWVIVKMDIEGAEWDIVPCLAESPASALVDRMYMEVHQRGWGLEGTTAAVMNQALQVLVDRGVQVPKYFSQT
jgi:FkbM family methyltransferase